MEVFKTLDILTSYAWYEAISSRTRITCTLWLVIETYTWGILSACAWTTNRLTSLTHEVTGLVLSAVIVCSTLHIDTGHQRVTLESCAADTSCFMELNSTLSTSTTWSVWVETWIQTILINTGFVERTIVISSTFWSVALCVRISSISFRTCADGMVSSGVTLSLRCTWVTDNTWVNTPFINTGFTLRTIWVLGTFRSGCN